VYSPDERDRVTAQLVKRAESDTRITGAALVGSSASGGDRWSDVDLTMAVSPDSTVEDVLGEWTNHMIDAYNAVVLFDLPVVPTIYRVFLLPGMLQVDLSFSPENGFGARGPRFNLLFGTPVEREWAKAPNLADEFGWAVHHVVRTHVCIEREKLWQAEYWLHQARDAALTLASYRYVPDARSGRGFDDIPADLLARFSPLVGYRITPQDLTVALKRTGRMLLEQAGPELDPGGALATMLSEIISTDRD
jgi:hypothetical protein